MIDGYYIDVTCPICGKETEVVAGLEADGDEESVWYCPAVEVSDRKDKLCGCDYFANDDFETMRDEAMEIRRHL